MAKKKQKGKTLEDVLYAFFLPPTKEHSNKLIRSGQVQVNWITCTDPETKVFDGAQIRIPHRKVSFVL